MKFILNSLIFLFILLSFSVYAKNDFNVTSQCTDEYEMHCDVYSSVGNKKNKILEDIKSPVIKQINDSLFYVKTSCGSPCQVYWFFSPEKEDSTDEFIALDSRNNCLIESDSNKKIIYARNLFSSNRKNIVNLKDKEFRSLRSRFDYYTYFKRDSYFDQNGVLNLISTDYSDQKINKKIENPCGKNK